MSITRVVSVDRGAGPAVLLRSLLPNLLLVVLAVYNTIRLFRHAMWRDELQAFMLAAASATPLDLFAKLRYEGHPGLWHLILWVITRFTTDPMAMQVTHLVIALGVWVLVWRFSPFRPFEKLLLLLSFFLFWEYFIISRSYGLMVLLAFGFIALRTHRPAQLFWPWVLLGLLANTTLFGTIWSLGLGAFFLWHERRHWREAGAGATVFAALLALALGTMLPASDYALLQTAPSIDLSQLGVPSHYVIGAFLPFFGPYVPDTLSALGRWGAALAATPFWSNPAPELATAIGDTSSSLLLATMLLVLLTAPILACWIIVRDRTRTAQYAAIYVGVLLFGQLWQFLGAARHHGTLFVALVGTVWMWRSAILPARPLSWVWIALLAINAAGGLTTLAADNRPFSQSRNAALWLERHHLDDAFLMGSADYAVSPIAGYLQRPIYYLECECSGTYVEWSTRRKPMLSTDEVIDRVGRVMAADGKTEAYLIFNDDAALQKQTADPSLTFRPLKRFPAAITGDEIFSIYRVARKGQ